jgi:hypothetical protein
MPEEIVPLISSSVAGPLGIRHSLGHPCYVRSNRASTFSHNNLRDDVAVVF